MSPANPNVDLDVLARERDSSPELPRPRRWLRFALPALLILAFLAVVATSLDDLLRGARDVALVRPVPVAGGATRSAPGQVVAQAAGWVEPDPFPIRVTALAEGVVREMLVQESDVVEEGAPLARLVDEDAVLALGRTEGVLARARGELARVRAEFAAALESFEAALAPTEALRVAEAELSASRAEAELRAQAAAAGRARLVVEEQELVVQQELEAMDAAGPRQVELAEARVEEARGALAALEAEAAVAAAGVPAAEARLERARRDLELRIEDRLRVAAAEAAVALAEGALAETQAARDEAALRLERMVVRAPASGVVLERLATIGTQLGGDSHEVATLFDPASIRVRVDVPQQNLAGLFVGQSVYIECDARPGKPYSGEVLRVVRRADIQKVTMQAHVRVLDGDALLAPEMLVQARFLAAVSASDGGAAAGAGGAVAIPARLLVGGDRVWVLDPERDTAALRPVRAGARDGELVVIETGLNLSDKLLDAGGEELTEGERVRAREERR